MQRRNQISVNKGDEFIIQNPVGIDRIITVLQSAFQELPWLTKSFGKAFKKYRDKDGSDFYYPSVWSGKNEDDLMLMGNDNWDAYTYSYPIGDTEYLSSEITARKITRQLEVVFWFNMDKVDPDATNEYTENLAVEISNKIGSTFFNNGDGVNILGYTDDPQQIYSEFSVDLVETQKLAWPYRGIKFTLEAIYSDDYCVIQN